MNNIEWKDGAACYANGKQWIIAVSGLLFSEDDVTAMHCGNAVKYNDFQLNEVRIGDYIERSELDTEQKYNDVVEVFGLFGFRPYLNHGLNNVTFCKTGNSNDTGLIIVSDNVELDYNGADFDNRRKRKLTYNQAIAIGKLKRMMLEREKSAPEKAPDLSADFSKVSSNKYEREISDRQGNSATVDVYDVLKAFEVTCPATQHAVKKLLCSGLRGHKDLQTDLIEAKESIVRAIELNGG